MKTTLRLALVTSCALALLVSAQPMTASADDGSSGVTVDRKSLTAEQRADLAADGVDGKKLDIETRDGMTMVWDGESWAVYNTGSTSSRQATPASLSFEAGVCAGSFFKIIKVNGRIEWGAQNSCYTLPPSSVYPHVVKATLRRGYGLFNVLRENRATTSSSSPYSQVATAFASKGCGGNSSHVFDQVVYVTVHGTQFGPKVSDEVTLNCAA